jgi:3-hydroxyisobutyrate dehydrogenase-like beta-hydroxyacid dehydrogenase
MNPVVAVIAPGMMGAAVGQRLVKNGIKVLTSLAGRSAETAARAKAAGMVGASDGEIVATDFILSILPPGDAVALARRFAGPLTASNSKPVFVDCNAVSPRTVERIAAAIAPTGAPFVDAGIIGAPPRPDYAGPTFYASGDAADRFAALGEYGLNVRVIDAPAGAASAMKMSYAGITKGFTALGAAMMLAATRAGTAPALRQELSESQPALLGWLSRQVPAMFPKAYRFVAEMEEIAEFVGEDAASREMYEGYAKLYARLAADLDGDKREIGALTDFVKREVQ